MKLDVIKKQIMPVIRKAGYFNRLKFVMVFGSVAEGKATKMSDIDVCLYYNIKDKHKLYKLLFKLKGIFSDKFDIQFFQLLPLRVRLNVFKGKVLYTADMDFVYDRAFETFREFEEFKPRYDYMLGVTNTL